MTICRSLGIGETKTIKRMAKIVTFRGNSGNSGRDGVLNSNYQGTGRGKTAGDLKKWVLRVPRGIPKHKIFF